MLPGIMLGFDYLWPLSLMSLGSADSTASGRRDAVKIPLVFAVIWCQISLENVDLG